MKTTKLIAVLAFALAASAASATDSYLYWLVDNANYNGNAINFSYATISADNGQNYLSLYSPGVASSETAYLASNGANSSAGAPAGVYAGFDGSVSSFLVELWSDSDVRVGWQSYGSGALADYIFNGTTGGSSTTPFAVSSVVPEPTSGVMMLLGIAALALKRRKLA